MADATLHVDVRMRPGGKRGPLIGARFDVEPGISALFGPSGAGKTTAMLAVAGLLTPLEGRITLGETVLFDSAGAVDLRPDARRVALVFQSLALFPHMSALDNVRYALPRAIDPGERLARARSWLERMHVSHVAERRPRTLSGGEAQRVALARALASEPRALLLDEPFSAIDDELRVELGRELSAVLAERPIPTVLVTHDRGDARRLAQRTIALDAATAPSP